MQTQKDQMNADLSGVADPPKVKQAPEEAKKGTKKVVTKKVVTKRVVSTRPATQKNKENKEQNKQLQVEGKELKQAEDQESMVTEETEDTKVDNQLEQMSLQTPQASQVQEEAQSQRAPLEEVQVQKPFYLQTAEIAQRDHFSDTDTQSFQQRLDSLILNFRSETMNEFIRTKNSVLKEQDELINEEKNKCTGALDVKQNEINGLTTALQQKTREASDMNIRSELLSILAGKNKMLMRVKVMQMKAFSGFKKYWQWKKYKKVLARKSQKEFRLKMSKLCFQAWTKEYKGWKEIKEQDRFENAVKKEVQSISSHYAKEIETLQQRLNEANSQVQAANRSKAAMEENMKKIFMKGIFAMNMEAYNVLGDQPSGNMENEIEKQMKLAMNAAEDSPKSTLSQSQMNLQQPKMNQAPLLQPSFQQSSNLVTTQSNPFQTQELAEAPFQKELPL